MTNGQLVKEGVCCDCQSIHPVRLNTSITEGDRSEIFGAFGCGEAGEYIMERHMMFKTSGPWCTGEGTIPQALVPDEPKPRTQFASDDDSMK